MRVNFDANRNEFIPNARMSPLRPLSWSRDRQGGGPAVPGPTNQDRDGQRRSPDRPSGKGKGKNSKGGKRKGSRSPLRRAPN